MILQKRPRWIDSSVRDHDLTVMVRASPGGWNRAAASVNMPTSEPLLRQLPSFPGAKSKDSTLSSKAHLRTVLSACL